MTISRILIVAYLLLFIPFWKAGLLGLLFGCALSPVQRFLAAKFSWTRKAGSLVVILALSVAVTLLFIYSVMSMTSFARWVASSPEGAAVLSGKLSVLSEKSMATLQRWDFIPTGLLNTVHSMLTDLQRQLPSSIVNFAGKFIFSLPVLFLDLSVFLFTIVLVTRVPRNKVQAALKIWNMGRLGYGDILRFEMICAKSLGYLLILSFLEAVIVAAGSSLGGLDQIGFLFTLTLVLSMIPLLGPSSLPALLTVSLFADGRPGPALILLVTLAIVWSVDHFLRAWFYSRMSKVNSLLSFLALLGALFLFGFPGLLIAPVLEQLAASAFHKELEESHVTA